MHPMISSTEEFFIGCQLVIHSWIVAYSTNRDTVIVSTLETAHFDIPPKIGIIGRPTKESFGGFSSSVKLHRYCHSVKTAEGRASHTQQQLFRPLEHCN